MRGTWGGKFEFLGVVRITPAYAGNICFFAENASLPKDHPRICGEHYDADAVGNYVTGSPPHMRGTYLLKPVSNQC